MTDVTDSGQVREAVKIAVERFGGLDVAFANAGVFGDATPIVDYPEDVFDRVIAVNVKGSFLVAKHALAACATGQPIFNSSVVGLLSDAGIAGYATSKHAIIGSCVPRPARSPTVASASTACIPGPSTTASSTASRSSPPAPRRTAPPSSSRSASR